jgi:16S rRNA (uracil1498-N3)-methyltransferase
MDPLGVVIGPEGGLSEAELIEFKDLGIQEVRLSPHTLRTETAAFPFLCAVQWLRGRL